MKKYLVAMLVGLVIGTPALAGTTGQDFKTLAPKIFKAPKATPGLKNLKNDVIIVYGGEDVSPRISNALFNA